ncbi:hypothetical protein, partial [Mycobacterium basiliense]
ARVGLVDRRAARVGLVDRRAARVGLVDRWAVRVGPDRPTAGAGHRVVSRTTRFAAAEFAVQRSAVTPSTA